MLLVQQNMYRDGVQGTASIFSRDADRTPQVNTRSLSAYTSYDAIDFTSLRGDPELALFCQHETKTNRCHAVLREITPPPLCRAADDSGKSLTVRKVSCALSFPFLKSLPAYK